MMIFFKIVHKMGFFHSTMMNVYGYHIPTCFELYCSKKLINLQRLLIMIYRLYYNLEYIKLTYKNSFWQQDSNKREIVFSNFIMKNF